MRNVPAQASLNSDDKDWDWNELQKDHSKPFPKIERNWSFSDLSMDSKTKLAQFYEKHDKMFKKRVITVAKETDPQMQEEPHDPDQLYQTTSAELIEEAFMLQGIS